MDLKVEHSYIAFFCPSCGEACFGSGSFTGKDEDRRYYCTGRGESGCHKNFECKVEDFWKYQRKLTVQSFATEEQYKEHYLGNQKQCIARMKPIKAQHEHTKTKMPKAHNKSRK